MNIFDAKKVKFDILVKCFVLISFASGAVGQSVYLQNALYYLYLMANYLI